MKTFGIIATLALSFAAISSFAAVSTDEMSGAHALTRAEVRAEYLRARQAGEIAAPGESNHAFGYSKAITTDSMTTRAQVLEELRVARANGELDIRNSMYGAREVVSGGVQRPRSEVVAGTDGGGLSRGGNQVSFPRN